MRHVGRNSAASAIPGQGTERGQGNCDGEVKSLASSFLQELEAPAACIGYLPQSRETLMLLSDDPVAELGHALLVLPCSVLSRERLGIAGSFTPSPLME